MKGLHINKLNFILKTARNGQKQVTWPDLHFIKNFFGDSIENRLEMTLAKYGIIYMFSSFPHKIHGHNNNIG